MMVVVLGQDEVPVRFEELRLQFVDILRGRDLILSQMQSDCDRLIQDKVSLFQEKSQVCLYVCPNVQSFLISWGQSQCSFSFFHVDRGVFMCCSCSLDEANISAWVDL